MWSDSGLGYSGLLSFALKQATYKTVERGIDYIPNFSNNESNLEKEHKSPGLIRLPVRLNDVKDSLEDLKQTAILLLGYNSS
ncbi:hypothetical protein SAMN05421663_10313 [Terribacillus halophilus]|uniref:Uncharacterized protein n=1 Tax=Terribacillus halophilus TaxID=361279 RepID=A0A1G6MNZ0_9BACI|nr:hypothetical protein SAMN05421663_10313 [Terribacillus halophilus]